MNRIFSQMIGSQIVPRLDFLISFFVLFFALNSKAQAFEIPSDFANCTFNGQTYKHNEAVTAFQNSSVSFNQTCTSELRICNNGTFSGSYSFSSCQVNQPASCLFNGQTVLHGNSVESFQNSTVTAGSQCVTENRICNDGVLSGSYQFSQCNISQPASCMFNGTTVNSGESVTAFVNPAVPYAAVCQTEVRTCSNGVLSGSAQFSGCSVAQPAGCLFNGQTVAHGQIVNAFINSSVSFGETCQQQERTCNNGILSGSAQFANCNVGQPTSCLFNGQTVAHGQVINAFATSTVSFNQSCQSEQRTCFNGRLSGSNEFESCSVSAPASCLFDGKTIAHEQQVVAFATSTVPFGETCQSEKRSCQNGVLTGSNEFSSCNVDAAASCLFHGQTIAHGQRIIAYRNISVPAGQICESEERICNNGQLSGSAENKSCVVNTPPVVPPPVVTPEPENPPVITPEPEDPEPPVVVTPDPQSPPLVCSPEEQKEHDKKYHNHHHSILHRIVKIVVREVREFICPIALKYLPDIKFLQKFCKEKPKKTEVPKCVPKPVPPKEKCKHDKNHKHNKNDKKCKHDRDHKRDKDKKPCNDKKPEPKDSKKVNCLPGSGATNSKYCFHKKK